MSFFSVDGGLYKFMRGLTDVFKINMLWLLFSLPIVTLGGATIAAFDVMMKMADNEEGYVGRQFVASFKKNFKCGIPYGLAFLICIYVVWFDFYNFEHMEGNPMILLIMGFLGAFVFLISFLYAFPLQARYENTFINTLRNSADISMKYFLRTLSLILVLFIEIVIICWNNMTMFIGFIIGPACIIYTISGYAKYFFRQLEKEPGAVSNPEDKE